MERLCMRPGCDRSVVARLTYDTISCQVWLDPVRERPGPAQEICELHTSRLTVPRGWMLCDRRDESPALFVPEPAAPADRKGPLRPLRPPARRARRARRARAAEPQPELFGVAAIVEDQARPVEPAARPAERRVEPRVAQTAPIVPAAPAGLPSEPEPVEPAAAAVAAVESFEDTPAAVTRNGERNGHGECNGIGEVRRNGDRAVDADTDDVPDADAAEHDDEDLPESLQATSPLLSRAFRATGHQRSVLTQTLLNDPD